MRFPKRVWEFTGEGWASREVKKADLIRRMALCERMGWHYDGPVPKEPTRE